MIRKLFNKKKKRVPNNSDLTYLRKAISKAFSYVNKDFIIKIK